MEIEICLYRIDPFRSSNAKIPYPFPVKITGPIISAERFAPLEAQIQDVILRHNITDRYTAQVRNISKPNNPNGALPVPTFLIQFLEATSLPESWSGARDEVVKLMRAGQYSSADVELIDLKRAWMPSIFPLPSQLGARHSSI